MPNRRPAGSPSDPQPTQSIRSHYPLMAYFGRHGLDFGEFVRRWGFEPTVYSDPELRFECSSFEGFWTEAARCAEDPALGLHVAEETDLNAFELLSHLCLTSPTVLISARRLERFFRLLADGMRYELVIEGSSATLLRHAQSQYARCPEDVDYCVAVPHLFYAQATVAPWTLDEVFFRHEARGLQAEYARVFQTTVRFGANADGFRFKRELLETPLRQGSTELSALLEQLAETRAQELPSVGDCVAQASKAISDLLSELEPPTTEAIAARMDLTPRTLQRKLRALGTTPTVLLDQVRQTTATALLRHPRLTLADVAILCGFSEQASFNRAFRRWTGQSPGTYRARLRQQ